MIKRMKKSAGIIPRAVADLLQMRDSYMQSDPNSAISVRLSYLEIYNERVFDLLPAHLVSSISDATSSFSSSSSTSASSSTNNPSSTSSSSSSSSSSTLGTDLPVREDAKRRVQVVGLAEHVLTSSAEFRRLFALGAQNRSVAATKLNAHSSRSHAVLVLKVEYLIGRLGI